MEYSTPGGIYPTGIAVADQDTTYVLGHPVGDGPVNVDTSIIFRVAKHHASALRIFSLEVTGIAVLGGILYAVDGDCNLHAYSEENWRDWEDIGQGVDRINALRVVAEDLYGLAGDGLIYRWNDGQWNDIVNETEDLYLYDMAETTGGTIYVAGERGHLSRLQGRQLVPIDLPTNADISSVLPLPGDRFLLTGWRATALIGSADEIIEIDTAGRTAAFANAVVWKNKILIAAGDTVEELVDNEITTFSNSASQRLAVGYDQLWKQWDGGVAVYVDGNWIDIRLAVEL